MYSYGGFLYDWSFNRRTSCKIGSLYYRFKDTVRGAAKRYGISKSTVHTEVTFQNGKNKFPIIPESIEIKKVFLAEKNPIVKLGLVIK